LVKGERVGASQFQARSVASINGGQSWWALLGGAPRQGEAATRWGTRGVVVAGVGGSGRFGGEDEKTKLT
jgi:hypothetical protein